MPVKRTAVIVCVLSAFFFLSCQTGPKIQYMFTEDTGNIPLNEGAAVYIIADAVKGKPILETISIDGMNNKNIRQLLDKTKTVSAGIYKTDTNPRFQVYASGNYPSFRANLALGTSRYWKKVRSGKNGTQYWYSRKDGISVALNSGHAYAMTDENGSHLYPVAAAGGTETPEGFWEFIHGSVIACWLENPGPVLNQIIAEMGIPIEIPAQRIFLSLFPLSDTVDSMQQYEALLRIQFSGPTQARGIAMLMTLAGAFISPENGTESGMEIMAAVLFANPPVQDGNNLDIKTGVLGLREISLLFNIFSLQ